MQGRAITQKRNVVNPLGKSILLAILFNLNSLHISLTEKHDADLRILFMKVRSDIVAWGRPPSVILRSWRVKVLRS